MNEMDRLGFYAVASRDKLYVTVPRAKKNSCGSVKQPLYEFKRIKSSIVSDWCIAITLCWC